MSANEVTGDTVAPEDGGEPADAPSSLLERLEGFDRWHGAATRPRPAPMVDGEEDADVPTILPESWRSQRRRRRRRGPKRRRIPWRVRISVVLVAVLIGVIAAAVIIYVPRFAEDRAADVSQDYRTELLAVQAAIPGAVEAAAAIADPAIDGIELSIRIVPFSRFQTASLSLGETVRKTLPELPPLFPDSPIQELAPTRERLSLVAGRADVITSRLSKFVSYRIEFEKMFVLPDLPSSAEAGEANVLSLALAEMLVDSLDALTALPSDPFLDEHRDQATATFEFFQEWEIDYLDALRRGATAQATALRADATGANRLLRLGLESPLMQLQQWADAELAGLDRDVTGALILVGS